MRTREEEVKYFTYLSVRTLWTEFIYRIFVVCAILMEAKFPCFTLREKCPNGEFFLVRIFLYLDQEKLHIWALFT